MQIDDLLDEFESSWASGDSEPDVRSVLRRVEGSEKKELACELIEIDIERRWKGSTTKRMTIHDYLRELPYLDLLDGELVSLMKTEFLVRNLWGDCPQPSMIGPVDCSLQATLTRELLQARNQLPWPRLRFMVQGIVMIELPLDRPTTIGRQAVGDPSPVVLLQEEESQRVIIAPSADPSISRAQLHLDLPGLSRLRLKNRSRNRSLAIQARQALVPGQTVEYGMPIVIPICDKRTLVVSKCSE